MDTSTASSELGDWGRIPETANPAPNQFLEAEVDLNVESSGWGAMVLAEMDSMRAKGQLCDVSLVSPDGPPLPAHSLVLSGGSAFFKQVLEKARSSMTSKTGSVVIKCNFSYTILSCMCDFLYRGRALPRLSQISEIQRAAKTFGVTSLLSLCQVFDEQGGFDVTCVTENNIQSDPPNCVLPDSQNHTQSYAENTAVCAPQNTKSAEPQIPTHPENNISTYPKSNFLSNPRRSVISASENIVQSSPQNNLQQVIQAVPPNAVLEEQVHSVVSSNEIIGEDNDVEDAMDYHEDIPHDAYESQIATTALTTIQHSDLLDITNTLKGLEKKVKKRNKTLRHRKDSAAKKDNASSGPRKREPPINLSGIKPTITLDQDGEAAPKRRYKYPCDLCDRSFTGRSRLEGHRATHLGDKLHKCNLCGKTYIQIEYLREHMTIHSGVMPFECERCKRRFRTLRACKAHEKRHLGPPKRFKCTLCPRMFARFEYCQNHIKVHNGERPYKCKLCDKTFTCTMNLNRHQHAHSDIKRYKCTQCDMAFKRGESLKKHILTHSSFRPFVCHHAECGAGFRINKELKKHIKTFHTPKPTTPPPKKKPKSPRKKSKSIFDTLTDVALDEPRETCFSCPAEDCAREFLHVRQLQKHVMLFHPDLQEKKRVFKNKPKDTDGNLTGSGSMAESTIQGSESVDNDDVVEGHNENGVGCETDASPIDNITGNITQTKV